LKELRSMLDPFELSRSIDQKLESIYALANRRLSPKAVTARGATAAGNGYIFVSTAAFPVTFLSGLTWRCATMTRAMRTQVAIILSCTPLLRFCCALGAEISSRANVHRERGRKKIFRQ